jgi:hypothetical protein
MISIPNALLIDRLNFIVDDDVIPPAGFELSLRRDDDMIVWKKVLSFNGQMFEYVIAKLKIPKDAAILFTPTKCRANRAIVLGFYPCEYGGDDHQLSLPSATSWYDHSYRYRLGQEISPDHFDSDWRKTCSHGIHFFRTFEEAASYVF